MIRTLAIAAALLMPAAEAGAEAVRLHAAGSLRAALGAVTQRFTAETGLVVDSRYGPSGLLRERLETGEAGGVFASADLGHPEALARQGRAWPVILFARNRLCAMLRPGIAATPETLLDRMLDPALRLASSTPGSDPSGDYAWRLFARAEAVRPGSRAALEAKALTLSGGPGSPQPPVGRTVYGWHLAENRADIYLGYCTAAREAQRELPGLGIVVPPPVLAVGADYGLTVLRDAGADALRLALFIQSTTGQAILASFGFDAPGLPQP